MKQALYQRIGSFTGEAIKKMANFSREEILGTYLLGEYNFYTEEYKKISTLVEIEEAELCVLGKDGDRFVISKTFPESEHPSTDDCIDIWKFIRWIDCVAYVKTNYECDGWIYVDTWLTNDNNEEGHTVARVHKETAEVLWLDNKLEYISDRRVILAIAELIRLIDQKEQNNICFLPLFA